MNKGTGVFGMFLALGAMLVSSANTKTAEARSSYSNLHAFKASETAPVVATTQSRDVVAVATPASAERITPPHLLENLKLRRMQKAEITPAMLQLAAQVVRKHYAKPVGSEVTVEIDGKQVTARIERHFHPEGGPVKPWGFHPGVSLFIAR